MKSISRLIIVLPFLLMLQLYCFSQNDTLIKPGYANVAILMVDYDTYSFEGGNLSHYTCPSCSNNSLPFFISLNGHSSDDFEVTFTLNSHFDTIFNSSTVWMGLGVLKYPTIFSSDYPFRKTNIQIPKPENMKYFDFYGTETNEPEFIIQADSAWKIIDSLEIVSLFSDNGFKTCILLYAPTIGIFDPKVAKWMIFLYGQERSNSKEEDFIIENMRLYPNPANDYALFKYTLPAGTTSVQLQIRDLYGRLVKEEKLEGKEGQKLVNTASLPAGTYIYTFRAGNKTYNGKMMVAQ
jgi:hypothetical protein